MVLIQLLQVDVDVDAGTMDVAHFHLNYLLAEFYGFFFLRRKTVLSIPVKRHCFIMDIHSYSNVITD